MPYQNIQAQLSESDKDMIFNHLAEIKSKLHFLVNLTPKEKKNAGQYAHDKYAFRKFAFEMAQANPHLLPPAEPLQEWESDITLFDTLRLISQDLKVLNEAISDTLFALGIESHKHAIHFLFMARLAARSNIAGMDSVVERLETALHGKS